MKNILKTILIFFVIIFVISILVWVKKENDKAITSCVNNGYSYDFCVSHI